MMRNSLPPISSVSPIGIVKGEIFVDNGRADEADVCLFVAFDLAKTTGPSSSTSLVVFSISG